MSCGGLSAQPDRQAVVGAWVDVRAEVVPSDRAMRGDLNRQRKLGWHASTRPPVDDALDGYTQRICERLWPARFSDCREDCVHADKSKRFV